MMTAPNLERIILCEHCCCGLCAGVGAATAWHHKSRWGVPQRPNNVCRVGRLRRPGRDRSAIVIVAAGNGGRQLGRLEGGVHGWGDEAKDEQRGDEAPPPNGYQHLGGSPCNDVLQRERQIRSTIRIGLMPYRLAYRSGGHR
jgi:hypothetical protein